MELKGKKVLVFGAGKSGIGAADLLNAVGAALFSTTEKQIWIKRAYYIKQAAIMNFPFMQASCRRKFRKALTL